VLILLDIEIFVAVPSKMNSELKTSEAINDDALVGASAHCGVSERNELAMIRGEYTPCIISCAL
jgi:hypothetical protein